ncbi:MAG: CRISPR-associated protein Cas4 [Candidatus Omnitrophota bacterium]
MYAEEDFIQLSALQHFIFCPRQCALIHIEQAWSENLFTAEGRVMHDKAHEERFETRDGARIERGMPLRSRELGLSGKADVVEFHKVGDSKKWMPFPVEYKRGKPKRNDSDKVQLCAQALCLGEMLGVDVLEGALFYGKTKRRFFVSFDEVLCQKTKETARNLHEFINAGITPKPVYAPKCDSCSLVDVCIPETIERNYSVRKYLSEEIKRQGL